MFSRSRIIGEPLTNDLNNFLLFNGAVGDNVKQVQVYKITKNIGMSTLNRKKCKSIENR